MLFGWFDAKFNDLGVNPCSYQQFAQLGYQFDNGELHTYARSVHNSRWRIDSSPITRLGVIGHGTKFVSDCVNIYQMRAKGENIRYQNLAGVAYYCYFYFDFFFFFHGGSKLVTFSLLSNEQGVRGSAQMNSPYFRETQEPNLVTRWDIVMAVAYS